MHLEVEDGTQENRVQLAYKLPSSPVDLMKIVSAISPEWNALYGALHAPENLIQANQVVNASLYFASRQKPVEVKGDTRDIVTYTMEKKWPMYVQFRQAQDQEIQGIGRLLTLASQLAGLGYRGRINPVMKEGSSQISMFFDMEPAQDQMLVMYSSNLDCPTNVISVCETMGIPQIPPEDFHRRFHILH